MWKKKGILEIDQSYCLEARRVHEKGKKKKEKEKGSKKHPSASSQHSMHGTPASNTAMMYAEPQRQLSLSHGGDGSGEGGLDEEDGEEEESRHRLLSASELNHASNRSTSSTSGGVNRRTGLLWTSATTTIPSSSPSPPSSGGAGADTASASAAAAAAPHGHRRGRGAGSGSCIQDLGMLSRVFLLRGLFVGRRWVFPALLACSAASYEVAASTILSVIGDFYLAISSMDANLFLQVSWRSGEHLILFVVVCFVYYVTLKPDIMSVYACTAVCSRSMQ